MSVYTKFPELQTMIHIKKKKKQVCEVELVKTNMNLFCLEFSKELKANSCEQGFILRLHNTKKKNIGQHRDHNFFTKSHILDVFLKRFDLSFQSYKLIF